MTRTLFFFTALAGMLFAMTAIMVRLELAYVDVSPLFMPSGTEGDFATSQDKFDRALTFIGVFGYLAVMLLGTTMLAAARGKGAWGVTPMLVLGVVVSASFAGLVGMSFAGFGARGDNGWVLFLPEGDTMRALLANLLTRVSPVEITPDNMLLLLIAPPAVLLFSGAYAMVSTLRGFRAMAVLGQLISLSGAMVFIAMVQINYDAIQLLMFTWATLPLIACGAIRLIDAEPPAWLIVLILGVLILFLTQSVILGADIFTLDRGPGGLLAPYFIFPLGIAWFALPALMIFSGPTRVPLWMPWAIPPALALAMSLWVQPILQNGWAGMQPGLVDYPATYAPQQLTATAGALIFGAAFLVVITLVRRHRVRSP